MTIKSKEELAERNIEIDLSGPEGNAFCLLGHAKNFCGQLGKDWESLKAEMTSDDYDHLVAVFDREFGSFVTLYR